MRERDSFIRGHGAFWDGWLENFKRQIDSERKNEWKF